MIKFGGNHELVSTYASFFQSILPIELLSCEEDLQVIEQLIHLYSLLLPLGLVGDRDRVIKRLMGHPEKSIRDCLCLIQSQTCTEIESCTLILESDNFKSHFGLSQDAILNACEHNNDDENGEQVSSSFYCMDCY
jgi:hypothetical protein